MNFDLLTGRTEDHLEEFQPEYPILLHRDLHKPLLKLKEAAATEGIDLYICSGFRSFERQKKIWNLKCEGVRKVLGESATEDEVLKEILAWSAIPGSSRHHWGTDIDVFDAAALPEDYRLKLEPEEYATDGVFAKLTDWLNKNLKAHHFFRPYDVDRGGVSAEPWHLSYAPLSHDFLQKFSLEMFEENVKKSDFDLKEAILKRSSEFYERYVVNVSSGNWEAWG